MAKCIRFLCNLGGQLLPDAVARAGEHSSGEAGINDSLVQGPGVAASQAATLGSVRPAVVHKAEGETKADVIDTTNPAGSVDLLLLEEPNATSGMLKDLIDPTCPLHNEELQELEKPHVLEYRDSFLDSVNFLMGDHPYNVLRGSDDKNWEHDQFSVADMEAMV